MPFNKPCLDCGRLTKKSRCPTCQTRYDEKKLGEGGAMKLRARKAHLYGGDYSQRAKQVRANAIICHICGEGAREGTAWAWEADHLFPELGKDSPLAPAHRVCNQRRGNKPLDETPRLPRTGQTGVG